MAAKMQFEPGDLVEVTQTTKLGLGTRCRMRRRTRCLVLVLRRYETSGRDTSGRDSGYNYPFSSYIEDTGLKKHVRYSVLRSDGDMIEVALEDYHWPSVKLTNHLVQCAIDTKKDA